MKNLVVLFIWLKTLLSMSNFTTIAALDVSQLEVESSFPSVGTKVFSQNKTWSTTSRVLIHIPDTHHNPDGEPHVSAGFGTGLKTRLRGTLGAYVRYVDDTLCQPLYITEIQKNKTIDVHPQSQAGVHAPFWLMVNRENCSFVTKARMAQQMGAAGVIFADNKCLCSDDSCNMVNETCQTSNPHVVDDGSAGDVSIPAFLLQKKSADSIKDGLGTNAMYLEYRWGLPDSTIMSDSNHPHVSYELWTTASPLDVPLLEMHTYKDLKTLTLKFADYIKFTPRYALIDGKKLGCGGSAEPEWGFCQELCTNNGRYCSVAPRNGIKGQDVVIESLRRICIWNHYGVNEQTDRTDNPILWDYVLFHMQHCSRVDESGSNFYSSNDCITDAYKHANIDSALINECMSDSGGFEEDRVNTWLEEEIRMLDSGGIVSVPTITINHKYVLDEPKPTELFDSMCKQYFYAAHESMMTDAEALKRVPALCSKCYSCDNKMGCIENDGECVSYQFHSRNDEMADNGKKQQEPSKKKGSKKFWIFFFLTAFALVGGVYYYKKNQDRFESARGGLLNGYFQLNQGE